MKTQVFITGGHFMLGSYIQFATIQFESEDNVTDFRMSFDENRLHISQYFSMRILDYKKDEYMLLYSCTKRNRFIMEVNEKHAWVLSRTPTLDGKIIRQLEKRLKKLTTISRFVMFGTRNKMCRSRSKGLKNEKKNGKEKRSRTFHG